MEFLFDGREFYFMEMNTRLQVEHTVTELVTGHAIEARVCAEDPERDFLPSAGDLRLLEWPNGEHVRVDAGFGTGDRVPETYDSLLGKVITWAPSRTQAAGKLRGALERTYCAGVRTNERWLARILATPRFLEGFIAASLDGVRVKARAFVYEIHVHMWLDGEHYDFLREDPRSKEFTASASRGDLTTPLPGVVAAVAVVAGQALLSGTS
jgi:acetyl/propionyl-CoA carboxylase alpha subunit